MAAPSTRSPILPATALGSWESYSRDTTEVVNWLCRTKKAKQLLSSQDQLHYKLLQDFAKACAHSGESLPTDVRLALERLVKTTQRFSDWVAAQRAQLNVLITITKEKWENTFLETDDLLYIQSCLQPYATGP
ncbi:hypothetical protein LZ32DRAFT_659449 [Colletotrichum eremochloae]|nr:hypothetical protein LZ32DRAFT_659449 [Colletotrichum eremochloae]